MADKKISQLTNLTGANLAENDEFVLVDTSADETKAITFGELKTAFDTGTGFVRVTGDTMTGDLSFNGGDTIYGDNDKAIFGAGSDLSIYHDGYHSRIVESGGGFLLLQGDGLSLTDPTWTRNYLVANDGGAVTLYHNGTAKLATTSTGIDVTGTVIADSANITGTVTADGLTVSAFVANSAIASVTNTDTANGNGFFIKGGGANSGKYTILSQNAAGGTNLKVGNNGDISFYEDTGTTPKFFWDASAESLGIGGASTAAALETRGNDYSFRGFDAAGNFGLQIYHDGAAGISKLRQTNSGGDLMLEAGTSSGLLFFNTAGSERMRIDSSGNVGIGGTATTGWATKQLVLDSGAGASAAFVMVNDTTGRTGTDGSVITLSGSDMYLIQRESANMIFRTANTERMRIDSSGNLLVGTTDVNPVANNITSGVQFGDGRIRASRADRTVLELNRKTSDGSIVEFRKDGTTVGSIGTTGGNIFLQEGAQGDGFGISSLSNEPVVYPRNNGANADGIGSLGNASLRWKDLYLSGGVLNGSATALTFLSGGTASNGGANILVYGQSNASLPNTTIFRRNGSESMRIDSSGNVGIGTSSPTSTYATSLHVNTSGNNAGIRLTGGTSTAGFDFVADSAATYIYNRNNTPTLFATNGTERMRIDSSGNLLVGKTSDAAAGSGLVLQDSTVHGGRIYATRLNNTNTQTHVSFYTNAGVGVGSISTTSSSTAYSTSSDYRLKTDAQPMTGASARVQALKPVNFEWIADGTRVDGFLAHEAQEVVPEAVTGTKDAVDADGNPEYQAIDQSKLVPLLTAALQEALTKIDALEARVTALEA